MRNLFCFGLGYSAQALARSLRADGWDVTGSARTEAGARELRRQGFAGIAFDSDAVTPVPAVAQALRGASHVLVSVPPQADGDPVLRHVREQLATGDGLEWIGYLSTVGVYGDTQGAWVDETSAVCGDFDRTRWRIAAERQWLDFGRETDTRVQVFRLAGIYGPGRSAIETLRAGRAQRIVKPGQVFNRIHVEDIARALAAALAGRGGHDVYNVTDDEPAPPQDVIAYAADLIGVAPPPEVAYDDAALSPMARSFYEANRRVSNARLKGDLGLNLAYPTYREGLRALADLDAKSG